MSTFVRLVLLCLIFLNKPVVATDEKILSVGFGQDKPPYVISEDHAGLYPDIMREALERMGYGMIPQYLSLPRMNRALHSGVVDIVTGLPKGTYYAKCYSKPFIAFENVAIVLKSVEKPIQSVDDLEGLNIIAFQQARQIIGEPFKSVTEANPNYMEVASQVSQVKTFAAGRAQVAVMDRNIFYWTYHHVLNPREKRISLIDIAEVRIFDWIKNQGAGFNDVKLCRQFEDTIQQMVDDGSLGRIRARYITPSG